ncbi:hypothetical protein K2X33_13600 [bacterium]|nr:hypothetical protein [bacterium]
MRVLAALITSLSLFSLIAAEPHDEEGRYPYLGKYPIYSVPVRTGTSHDDLDEVDEGFFSKSLPYARSRPKPFYYKTDVDAAKADPKLKDSEPFLIGGVNCDKTLQQVKTLTGVSIDHLSERVKGHSDKAQFKERTGPAWEGANNTHLRSSGDGFIKPDQALRELLLNDNRLVRSLGLTHQKIAEPLLEALEILDLKTIGGTLKKVDVDFSFNGEEYSVSQDHMGGVIKTYPIRNTPEEELSAENMWTGLANVHRAPHGSAPESKEAPSTMSCSLILCSQSSASEMGRHFKKMLSHLT